jgi:exopolysaccharide transport family protein
VLQRSIENRRDDPGYLVPAHRNSRARSDFDGDALAGVLRTLRRNLKLIVATALVGTVIATTVVFTMTPLYKATVLVLVDPRQTTLLQDSEVVGRAGTDSGTIDSEAEMIKSPAIMRAVAEQLGLLNDQEFAGPNGIIGYIRMYVIAPIKRLFTAAGEEDPLSYVVEALDKYSDAKRRALTYVIELNAWSRDSGKSVKIANAFAERYLAEQVAAKEAATRRATEWLTSRVEEMKNRVKVADKELEQYKAEAGLFDPAGENLSDRQIASLNDQLVDARAKAAAAHAKYDQLKQITPDKLPSAAASPDVLQSTVVSNLRGQYADAARHQAERTARYGSENPLVIDGQAEVAKLEAEITAEVGRIITSSKTEYEMAKSREDSLTTSLEELKERAGKFNQAAVRLHELEREAQANHDLFQSFLGRAKQTAELNLQVPDSRVVSAATLPTSTSYPKRAIIIGIAFFGSLGLGVALALARDMLVKGFRSAEDVETTLGVQPLVSIPLVEGSFRRFNRRGEPLLGGMKGMWLAPGPATNGRASSRDRLASARRLASLVIDQPDSAFAESIRALRLGIRRSLNDQDSEAILVTSALPGEGKSTIAANLAREAALSGERVLLIDGDLRHPTLAASLNLNLRDAPATELTDLLVGHGDFRASVRRDVRSDLYVIAGTGRVSGSESLMLLSSEKMRRLIDVARNSFDLVVIDASPLLPIADARVLVDQVDGVLLVVESEQTSREAVAAALRETPAIGEKMIGIVLNQATEDFDRYYRDPDWAPVREKA